MIRDKVRDCPFITDYLKNRIVQRPLQGAKNAKTIINELQSVGLKMDNQGLPYVADLSRHEMRRWRVEETQWTVAADTNEPENQLNHLYKPRKVFVDQDHSAHVSE